MSDRSRLLGISLPQLGRTRSVLHNELSGTLLNEEEAGVSTSVT